MEDGLQWIIALAAFGLTVALKAEVALVFIGTGVIGAIYYGGVRRGPFALAALVPPVVGAAPQPASLPLLGKIALFFLRAGSLTFGSGLVIVPFLEKGHVQENGWLSPRDFLIAVAVGMIRAGPVVITATFVGFLVSGFWGSLTATVAIIMPSFLFVLIAAPLLQRHRGNVVVQGFIKGAYGAAIGTIVGACVLLARTAIGDILTAAIALVALGLLFRFKISNPVLIAGGAAVGLVAFPLLKPTWMMIH